MDFENVKIIEDFDKWKKFLRTTIKVSKTMGFSDEFITDTAKKLGDFLEHRVDPENKEQRLLKQLWDVATETERHTLAHVLVKMVLAEEK